MEKTFDIENSEDFEKIVSKIQVGRMPFIGEQYQELYRGQSKNSYVLKSGISRYAGSKVELIQLEKNIISDFKERVKKSKNGEKIIQLSISNNNNLFENDWRWIEQIQHYRIPTRLLDWTIDPKIGLFFAVESNESEIGQFWVFKSPLNWSCNDHFELNPYNEEIDIISNSSFYIEKDYRNKIAEQRRSFQSGKFTFQGYDKILIPLESQTLLSERMLKFTIRPESKKELLDYLSKFNITKETIYVEYDNEIESIVGELKSKFGFG